MVTAVLPALPAAARSSASTSPNAADGDPAPGQQDVLGAKIAVADVAAVGVDERLDQLPRDGAGLVHRQLALAGQPVAQRGPFDRRRGEVDESLEHPASRSGTILGIVQRRDPLQGIHHPGTVAEPGQPRPEHMQLDRPGVAAVPSRRS